MSISWENFKVNDFRPGTVNKGRIRICEDALGDHYELPMVVVRGSRPGPVLGITASVHGNEVNGLFVIQRVIADIDPHELAGTIVAILVVNIPGFLANRRQYIDDEDLNRVMPGRPDGSPSAQFNHRFLDVVISKLNYLIDLHTASFGRVNSLYVRVDTSNKIANQLAYAMYPQIILNNDGVDGSLRQACDERDIPAITVEVGNPQVIQDRLIDTSYSGVLNCLQTLEMYSGEFETPNANKPFECRDSYWIHSDQGGVLDVPCKVAERIVKGQTIGVLKDIFGDDKKEFYAQADGVVIGKSTNPICHSGSRIIHLGLLK